MDLVQVVGKVAELGHRGIFNLCRQKPPPEAANRQLFPPATSRYSCLQMAAGRRDNSAGSQGYGFVVAKCVCLPVGPDMVDIDIPGTAHSLDWANVQAYASIFKGMISPEMESILSVWYLYMCLCICEHWPCVCVSTSASWCVCVRNETADAA
jgi:hypothetical protein